jgi:hypothetical protein
VKNSKKTKKTAILCAFFIKNGKLEKYTKKHLTIVLLGITLPKKYNLNGV